MSREAKQQAFLWPGRAGKKKINSELFPPCYCITTSFPSASTSAPHFFVSVDLYQSYKAAIFSAPFPMHKKVLEWKSFLLRARMLRAIGVVNWSTAGQRQMTGLGPLSLSPSKHKGWRAKNGKGRKCKHKNIHKYASYKGKGGQRDKERPFKMVRKLFPVPSVPAQSFLFNTAKSRKMQKMQQNALPCSGCSVRSRVVGYEKKHLFCEGK